jgi:hypothetical protein
LGAKSGVLREAFRRYAVNLGGQLRECMFQVIWGAIRPLTVYNPPLKLELRRLLDIERYVAHLVNRCVKTHEIRKRPFVIGAIVSIFEEESGFGSMVRAQVGPQKGQVVLRADQLGQL